jgi:hypothetical protein
MPRVATKKKGPVEKVVKKKVVKKKVEAKKATKAASNGQTTSKEIEAQVLKFMRKGKEYSSREVVEGLDRTPGQKEGGPVINVLKRLAVEKVVKYAANEGKAGYAWVK